MKLSTFVIGTVSAIAALGLGCGGNVIVDSTGAGVGGDGGAGGSTTTTTTTTTNPNPCSDHSQCAGGVCIFSTGFCGVQCDFFEPCPQGQVCNDCATSSCPQCNDCIGVCQPATPGSCDDHDDCNDGFLCLYGLQECAPKCDNAGGCADPNLVCNQCATSSCSGCDNCLGACTESF